MRKLREAIANGEPFQRKRDTEKNHGSALDVTEHELLTQELRRREAFGEGMATNFVKRRGGW